MENKKLTPEQVAELKPEKYAPLEEDTCASGYYWDEKTASCILDVGALNG